MKRRTFLKTTAKSTAMLSLGGASAWSQLAQAQPTPAAAGLAGSDWIPVQEDIEPLVRLIQESPRERVVAVMSDQVRRGLSYRRFLAATFLAAIRYFQAGSHSIFVAHAIDHVGLNVAREDQFLPLFYYLGVVRSQYREKPALRPIAEDKLPAAGLADLAFRSAMQNDEKDVASAALLALARHEGPRRAFERLWPYAAERNLRSGGHTAIAVSNAFRTLDTIGWEHVEPVFHFLAGECCQRPTGPNQLYRENAQRAQRTAELPAGWAGRRGDRARVLELLALFRDGAPDRACQSVFEQLRHGAVQAGDVWDAVFLTTAELLARHRWCGPAGLSGHSITCTNALHFAFRTVTAADTQLYMLLEAVEWTTTFLRSEREDDELRDLRITEIAEIDAPSSVAETVEEIFGTLPPRRFFDFSRSPRAHQDRAMQLTFAMARKTTDHQPFLQKARRLLCLKSTREVHDFKYPVALFEHYQHASPEWKPNLLAASVHHLHGTQMDDSPTVAEAREELRRS